MGDEHLRIEHLRVEHLRIERGVPTDEELAAIVGVLLFRGSSGGPAAPQAVSRWAASARPGARRPDGRPTRPSSTAWRASALPQ